MPIPILTELLDKGILVDVYGLQRNFGPAFGEMPKNVNW